MSKIAYVSILALASAFSGVACSSNQDSATSDDDLRGISSTEAESELTSVVAAIKANYGPLAFKTQRFGLNLDAEAAAAKAKIKAGKTEGDRVRPIYELLAKLHDSHVSYQYPLPGSRSTEYDLPLLITPYEGKYLVDLQGQGVGLTRGDVVESIDGFTMAQLNEMVSPLVGEGNPDTETIMTAELFTFRPFYIPNALIPKGDTAHIVVTQADGTTKAVDVAWQKTAGGLAGVATNSTAAPQAGTASSAVAAKAPRMQVGANFSSRANFLRQKKEALLASNPVKASGLGDFAQMNPWWLTQASVGTMAGIKQVSPSADTLKAMGVTLPGATKDDKGNDKPPAFLGLAAFKYQYEGKTILLVRIPGFETPQTDDPNEDTYGENIAWLAALLKDNLGTATVAPAPAAGGDTPPAATDPTAAPTAPAPAADPPADVVILDETANPGGLAPYALAMASLFATKPIPGLVQAMHADRGWLSEYNGTVQQLASFPDYAKVEATWESSIETAYDAHKTLTADFLPLSGDFIGPNMVESPDTILGSNMLAPNPNVQWGKPVLVLHDNLSVSCADFFPAILQNAGVAKTFGARTMGGGGNVAPVLTTAYSGSTLSLTRGMGGPFNPNGAPKLIENEGVTPDFAHPVTVADFRAGFVDYVKDFSHQAATLTRAE